ncbi:MAG: hypothetical protein HYV29_12195, partial [Ignavibacteriales bacterium]|nr:hypothetical protein [Ignavibacteriales bacterium]
MKIFFVLFITVAAELFSQTSVWHNRYVVQQWNVEAGLPQSTVRCITQTREGYLWVGTWNGLARFDGVTMKVFRSANVPALHSSNIMSLFTDSKGRLWIGTDPGGLVLYADGLFTRFDSTDGFSATRILSINEDRSGRIWFATEIGIFAFDGKKFLHFTEDNGLIRTYANQVLPYPDGAMYLGFVGYGSRAHLEEDLLMIEDTFPVGGYAVGIDIDGTVWFGSRDRGLVKRINGNETVDKKFAGVHPGETYILRNNSKWLLTPNNIHIISEQGKNVLTKIDHVTFESITTVFEDREDNIWLGKEGGGLILLRKKQVEVLTKENGLYSNEIMSGLEDRSGRMWIGTWNGGLQMLPNISSNTFLDVPLPKKTSGVYTLCESSNGTIWAGAWGAGLYSVHGKSIRQFVRGIVQPFTSIVAVAEDTGSGLWVGTAHEG